MGCIKLDILERAPSKRSPQIRMGSNCKPITKKGVSTYTFGFQGQEQDNEIKQNGNSYDFGARIYDPRIGRFLSIDPKYKDFSFQSPYSISNNNPVIFIDLEGEKGVIYIQIMVNESGEPVISKETVDGIVAEIIKEFQNIDVDCDVEIIYSNSLLSKEEFEKRDNYDPSDSYVIIGSEQQLINHNNKSSQTGWPFLDADFSDIEGTSEGMADESFYSVINADNATSNTPKEFLPFKLAQRILHETGHPKFRGHPENRTEQGMTNPGVSGHVYHYDKDTVAPTVMVQAPYTFIHHDVYMIIKLQLLHGRQTKPSEKLNTLVK